MKKDSTDYRSRYIPEHLCILNRKESVAHSPITKKERIRILASIKLKERSGDKQL